MPNKYAPDFSPQIRWMYNGTGTAIAMGVAIQRSTTVSTVADAADEEGEVTRKILGCALCLAESDTHIQNFMGVAQEATSAGQWVPVVVGGPAKVLVRTALAVTEGMALNPSTTLGAFINSDSPYTMVAATSFGTATATATVDTLIDAFVNDTHVVSGNGFTNP